MKLRDILLVTAAWVATGGFIVLVVTGCEQEPKQGDVKYGMNQLQIWQDGGWQCWIDKKQLNNSFARLEQRLIYLECGGHEYKYTGLVGTYKVLEGPGRFEDAVLKRYYGFVCSGCGREYSKQKCDFGDVEKTAMREFCDTE